MKRATGADDSALAETTWPLPDDEMAMLVHHLTWNNLTAAEAGHAAAIVTAYRSLIMDSTTAQQTKRLAALRRVHRRKP